MISFASYAFNKSHAACYAYVAFQTAYLKCHYPHEFMAALLTSVLDNTSKVIEYTTECQRLGIKVQQPDINISRGGFTADGDLIRFGLNAVKSVGRGLIDAVIKERAQRPYRSLYDFCKRLHGSELNRRALENLIKAGAFDALEPTRRGMLESVEGILKSVETDARQNLDGQMDLFGLMSGGNEKPADDYKVPELPEYAASELLKMEKRCPVCTCPATRWTPTAVRSLRCPPVRSPSCWGGCKAVRQPECHTGLHHRKEQDHDHEIQHADGVYDRGGSDRQYGTACIPAYFGRMPRRPAGKCSCGGERPCLCQGG